MNNNDILRRLRHALDLKNSDLMKIIGNTGTDPTPSQISSWLKRGDDPGYVGLPDSVLCRFLDGLIIEERGKRADGSIPEPLEELSNNEILRKLRISLELHDDGMNTVFANAKFEVTKAELGSFFRKKGHRHYRECPEQVLRKFIAGLGRNPRKKSHGK